MKYFCRECQTFTERDQDKYCVNCKTFLIDAPIAPGTEIGGFELLNEIGRGANGIVYLARQLTLERDVALKVLPEGKAEDPKFVTDLLKEARAAARLNHPNIVQAYDAGMSSQGIYFFAMEYIRGRTLDEYISEQGALPHKQGIEIAIKVAKALDYAWEKQRLFHGDIKPDNIIMREDGEVKLADLGLATTIFEEKSEEVMATPMYAPPEVIRAEHDKFGLKSDMYSFGAALYEIFCGEPPFNEYDCTRVMEMHLHEKHVSLKTRIPLFPAGLSDLVDALLSKKQEDRPKDWKSIICALKRIKIKSREFTAEKPAWTYRKTVMAVSGLTIAAAGVYFWLSDSEKMLPPAIESLQLEDKSETDKSLNKASFAVKNKIQKTKPARLKPVRRGTGKAKQSALPVTIKSECERLIAKIRAASEKGEAKELDFINQEAAVIKSSLGKYRDTANGEAAKAMSALNNSLIEYKSSLVKLKSRGKTVNAIRQRIAMEKKRSDKLLSEVRNSLRAAESDFAKYKLMADFSSAPFAERTPANLKLLMKRYGKRISAKSKALINKLSERLPEKYQPQDMLQKHFHLLKGQKLPWTINAYCYTITRNYKGYFKVKTKYSEGAYGLKKVSWNKMTDDHILQLWNHYIINGRGRFNKREITAASGWLFTCGQYKLLSEFTRNYGSHSQKNFWNKVIKLVEQSKLEASALQCLIGLLGACTAKKSEDFSRLSEHWNQEFCETLAFMKYSNVVRRIVRRVGLGSPQVSLSVALLKKLNPEQVMDIWGRFYFLKCINKATKDILKKKYNAVLRLVRGNRDCTGKFGIFEYVPPGGVYGWAAPSDNRQFKAYPLLYIASLIDVGSWNEVYRAVVISPNFLKIKAAFSPGLKQWYPSFLYSTGWAAWRLDCNGVLKLTLDRLQNELQNSKRYTGEAYAMAADLALKLHLPGRAVKILDQFKNEKANRILLPLYYLKAFMADSSIDERRILSYVESFISNNGNNRLIQNDIELMEIFHKMLQGKTNKQGALNAKLLKGSSFPRLWGELFCEVTARAILNKDTGIASEEVLTVVKSVAGDSVFYADINRRILLLELSVQELFPDRALKIIQTRMDTFTPGMLALYAELLLLRSGFVGVIEERTESAKTLRAFINFCPLFSPFKRLALTLAQVDEKSAVRLFQKIMRQNPSAGTALCIGVFTALVHGKTAVKRSVINSLKQRRQDMCWTEKLFFKRFENLCEALAEK
ncbi:serine/threonine-protein kinase [Lentisphaerota bacterium ZTH]|nr:serine/threonine protein kinase [Lentisphaerota bacterium]WET05103.1 serine/threonine-protein kinase [Lentisphaerota bacterium ZTH]